MAKSIAARDRVVRDSLAALEQLFPDLTFEKPTVSVREAHDLDRNNAWAATIEQVSPLRRPLHLSADVCPEHLFDKKAVRADVLVTYTLDSEGEHVPSLYYLRKLQDEKLSA